MCPSRLPNNEETSYRPSGMLDRDQRTAFTISRIRSGPSVITATTTASSENNRSNSSHQCNNTSVKCDITVERAMKDISGGYSYRCKCDCQQNYGGSLWEDSIRHTRKYTTTGGYYRSQTKFVNYLLVFICIWLATIHSTCAYPLSQSGAMLAANNEDPEAQRCRAIKDALNKSITQTIDSSTYILGLVRKYTQAQFGETPDAVHQVWRKHAAHFDYSRGIEKFLPKDFKDVDGKSQESHVEHFFGEGVPTAEELSEQFQRIYIYLHTLKQVFEEIITNRSVNESQILHHLGNNREKHKVISHLFQEQFNYNNQDIQQLKTAMAALQIPDPKLDKVNIGEKERVIGEWLATREYLKVLKYMQEVFNILLNRCSLETN